jgi:MoxR-like ATPase
MFDHARIKDIVKRIKIIEEWLNSLVQERETMVHQAILALIMQQHMLIQGSTGTGKSFLVSLILKAIEGEKDFKINLTKFTSASAVFGPINPKILREQGVMLHNLEDSAVMAHILYLDEFLDANDPVLRSLLTLLFERQFKSGTQQADAWLMTAFATTNGDPWSAINRNPELEAVIDRFIFKARVEGLKDRKNRKAMINNYLVRASSAEPPAKVTIDELQFIAGVVKDHNLILDPYIIKLYLDVLDMWGEKTRPVTDRTMNLILESLEAQALLSGRNVATLDDLKVLKYVLCEAGNQEQERLFDGIEEEIIQPAINSQVNIDDLALQNLELLERRVPEVNRHTTRDEVERIANVLRAIRTDVEKIRPQTIQVQDKKKHLLDRLDELKDKSVEILFGGQ